MFIRNSVSLFRKTVGICQLVEQTLAYQEGHILFYFQGLANKENVAPLKLIQILKGSYALQNVKSTCLSSYEMSQRCIFVLRFRIQWNFAPLQSLGCYWCQISL